MIFCILFCFALSQTINKCICLVDANQEVVPGQKSETCSIGCPFEDIDFFDHSINEQLDLMSEDFSEEYTGLYLFFVDATNGEETLKLSNIKTSCKNVSLVVGPLQIDAAFKTLKVNLFKGPNIFDYLEFMHIDLVNTILNEENAKTCLSLIFVYRNDIFQELNREYQNPSIYIDKFNKFVNNFSSSIQNIVEFLISF